MTPDDLLATAITMECQGTTLPLPNMCQCIGANAMFWLRLTHTVHTESSEA